MKTLTLKDTGETMSFIKSDKDIVEVIIDQPEGQEGPRSHKHTAQQEYFEVRDGAAVIVYADKKIVLQTGESFMVPEDTWHRYFSADGKRILLKVSLQPALDMEYFLVESYCACNERHSEDVSFFDNCYFINEMKGQYYLQSYPVFLQKLFFPLIGKLAKLFGLVEVRPRSEYRSIF